jgi:sec-independent protein translocase protein TatA
MIALLEGPELVVVVVLVLLLFGGSQLPKLAKNLGKAQKEFKDGLAEGQKAASGQSTPAEQPKTDGQA